MDKYNKMTLFEILERVINHIFVDFFLFFLDFFVRTEKGDFKKDGKSTKKRENSIFLLLFDT